MLLAGQPDSGSLLASSTVPTPVRIPKSDIDEILAEGFCRVSIANAVAESHYLEGEITYIGHKVPHYLQAFYDLPEGLPEVSLMIAGG